MIISNVKIKNFRNIESIDIPLSQMTVFVGENNSGKSNILKALTLPLGNDEIGQQVKRLGWQDINDNAKKEYFKFLYEEQEEIKKGNLKVDAFKEKLPYVSVELIFEPSDLFDEYYLKNFGNEILVGSESILYGIEYRYEVENAGSLLEHLNKIFNMNNFVFEEFKMNLLPMNFYNYFIRVTSTQENVSYADLHYFKYNSLEAERDNFSMNGNQLGSRALVNLLEGRLPDDKKLLIEKAYKKFFDGVNQLGSLNEIVDFSNREHVENIKDIFNEIKLLPNMPNMKSLLNNVSLGIGDEYLHTQGLGQRNLIYIFLMIASLEKSAEALNVLTLEEPEAHLSVSNIHLFSSYINAFLAEGESNKKLQIFISTHSPKLLNKLSLENIVVVTHGQAYSLKKEYDAEELNYLGRKPNQELLEFLFSKKCILVEGPSEELLIKSYLNSQTDKLNEINVLSLHKGFKKMLDLWLKVNKEGSNKIAIIRDYDNQSRAMDEHHEYNQYDNICVETTTEYTLEPEFIKTEDNFPKLKSYFEKEHRWSDIETEEGLDKQWRSAKADTMFKFCLDFGTGDLEGIKLPSHIQKAIDFLLNGDEK